MLESALKLVHRANKDFLSKEMDLLEADISERCLCATLMKYIEKYMKEGEDGLYQKHYCDVEYNRYRISNEETGYKKMLALEELERLYILKNEILPEFIHPIIAEMFPAYTKNLKEFEEINKLAGNITCDLIVHARGNYELNPNSFTLKKENLIALEMKKAIKEDEYDIRRLKNLTSDLPLVSYDLKTDYSSEITYNYILGIFYQVDCSKKEIALDFYKNGIKDDRLSIKKEPIDTYKSKNIEELVDSMLAPS